MEIDKMRSTVMFTALLFASLLISCGAAEMRQAQITDVYVEDFNSDDMKSCRPSDVPLDNSRALHFFHRARQVDYTTIHDHYNIAPCYVEGTLKYGAISCEWRIRAGATAQIKCGRRTQYFVCDNCEDLFREQ